jgi:hypothetical protein
MIKGNPIAGVIIKYLVYKAISSHSIKSISSHAPAFGSVEPKKKIQPQLPKVIRVQWSLENCPTSQVNPTPHGVALLIDRPLVGTMYLNTPDRVVSPLSVVTVIQNPQRRH